MASVFICIDCSSKTFQYCSCKIMMQLKTVLQNLVLSCVIILKSVTWFTQIIESLSFKIPFGNCYLLLNPSAPNASFLYPLENIKYIPIRCFIQINLASHRILHYLGQEDLSKRFNIYQQIFINKYQYFFQQICSVESFPTLLISWFINFNIFAEKHWLMV